MTDIFNLVFGNFQDVITFGVIFGFTLAVIYAIFRQ